MKVYVVVRLVYRMVPNTYNYGSSTFTASNTLYYSYSYSTEIDEIEKVFDSRDEADKYIDDRFIHNRNLGLPEIYFNIIEKEIND